MNETGARGPDQVETEGHEVAHGTASVNGRDVKGEAHAVVSEQVESPDEDDDDWVREQHELDCPLCRALLYEPITTVCGHNFCRSCIVRALDYNNRCPVCRAVVYLAPNHAVNSVLKNLAANTFPKEYRRRIAQTKKEAQEMCHNLPLFVLNIVLFPGMALDLHVFEPRYRNLIAHSLASSRCFGVINGSSKTGCVVEVSSYLRIPDGRSLLLVKGTNRFSVLKRWESPEYGYEIAEVSMLHDRSPDESAMPPAAPVAFDSYNDDDDGHASPAQQRHADGPSLQQVAAELRDLVQQKIPPSALQTFQQQLGPLPPQSEPQELSFWVAAYLPVGLTEHQQLLEMTSARDRLVREKELLLNLNTRTIQQRRAPTVARSVDGRRGLAMHVILLVCFIILLIWTRSLEDSLHAEQEPSCLLPSA